MITEAEATDIRDALINVFPDTCVIKHRAVAGIINAASDGYGGLKLDAENLEGGWVTKETVNCLLQRTSVNAVRSGEELAGAGFPGKNPATVCFPYDTELTTDMKLEITEESTGLMSVWQVLEVHKQSKAITQKCSLLEIEE